MYIVVFVDEKGTEEGECEHREFAICEEDKQNLFVMLGHSREEHGKPEKVYVLSMEEYGALDDKAKKYDEYIDWRKAKDIYNRGKGEFENLH